MLKAMICQPMAGLAREEILANRDKIVERLSQVEVIDTLFDDVPNIGGKDIGIYLLSKSLEAMSKADIVIFADGWQNARGCKIEHEVACAYDKPIIELYKGREEYKDYDISDIILKGVKQNGK